MRPLIDKIGQLTQLERVAAITVTQALLDDGQPLDRVEAIFAALHAGGCLINLRDVVPGRTGAQLSLPVAAGLSRREAYWAAATTLAIYEALGEEGTARVIEFLAHPLGVTKILVWAEAEATRGEERAAALLEAEMEASPVVN